MHPDSWRSRAACRDHPTWWWFSHPDQPDGRRARAICDRCPVRVPCADEQAAWEARPGNRGGGGIFGALTEGERAALRQSRERHCQWCNALLPPHIPKGTERIYCEGRSCRQAASRARAAQRERGAA